MCISEMKKIFLILGVCLLFFNNISFAVTLDLISKPNSKHRHIGGYITNFNYEVVLANEKAFEIEIQKKYKKLTNKYPKNFIELAVKHCSQYKKNTLLFVNHSYIDFIQKGLAGKYKIKAYCGDKVLKENFLPSGIAKDGRQFYKYKRNLTNEEVAKNESKQRLAKLQFEKQQYDKLENLYSKDCLGSTFKKGFDKGSPEYKKCIYDKNKEVVEKRRSLEKKLAKMGQMERIEYQCENIFNFRKNSSRFKDCTLKVYVAESEAEKIKLEKQLVQAKLEIKKTKELEKQAALLAQRDKRNTQGLGSFLDLITLGLQIYSLTSPVPSAPAALPTKTLQCFTSGMFEYCS